MQDSGINEIPWSGITHAMKLINHQWFTDLLTLCKESIMRHVKDENNVTFHAKNDIF